MNETRPDGYLALPKSGAGAGVLILHAWWGLNAFFQDLCKRLAREGLVAFYGTRTGDYAQSQAVYLCHFVETDEWVAASGIKKMDKALRIAHRPATFYTYAGTGHWFFEKDRADAHDPGAARLAWRRTVTFLRDTLTA